MGHRVVTSEDSPELMGSGSSSDDEASLYSDHFISSFLLISVLYLILTILLQTSDHALKLADPETKRQTMVDRFQEALCATSCNDDEALVAVHKPLR